MDRTEEPHWRALERMYLGSPINTIYEPSISVSHESAEISILIQERFFHAAGAIHGSVTWKMLDDAAFFAVASVVDDVFVLTTSFTSYLTRPVSEGKLRSLGRIVNRNRSQIVAEAVAFDQDGREVGRGSGIFVRSKQSLAEIPLYGSVEE
ncbi:MAG: PaaI family thioesterase [Gemmatimonadota bacterium]|nr:PaaI family thioesterase [Gemmatimonadota bacterium]